MASVAEVETDTERPAGFRLAEKPPTFLSQQAMDAFDKIFMHNYSLSDDSDNDDEEIAALLPKYDLKVPELDVLKCLRGVQEEPDAEVEISESYLEELISEANEGMKATGLGFLSNAFDTDDLCKDAVQTTFLTYEFKYPSTQEVIDKARKIDLKSIFDTDEEIEVESSGPLEPEEPLPGTSRSFQQQQKQIRAEVVTIISSDEEDVVDVDDSEELPDTNLETGSKDTNDNEKEKIDNQKKALSQRVPENGHQSEFHVQTEGVPSSFIDKNLEVTEPLKKHQVDTKKKITIEKKGPEEIKYKNIEEIKVDQIKVVLKKVDVEEARRALAEQGKQRKTETKSCEDLSLNQQNAQKDSETVTEGESRIQDTQANVDIGHEKSENVNREGELPNKNNPRVIDTIESVQIGDREDVEENNHTKNEKLKDITMEKVKKRGRKPKCKEEKIRQADSDSLNVIDGVLALDKQNQNQEDSTEIGDSEASTEMLIEQLPKPFLRMTRSRLRKRKDVHQKDEVVDTENPKNNSKENLITARPRQKRKAVKRIQRIPVEDGEVDTECEKSEKVNLKVEIRNGEEKVSSEPVKHDVPSAKIIESVPSATTPMSVEPAVAENFAELVDSVSLENVNLTVATIPSERVEPTVASSENLQLTVTATAARSSEHVDPTPTALSSEKKKPAEASLPSEPVEPAVVALHAEPLEPAVVVMPSEPVEPAVVVMPSEPVEPAVVVMPSKPVEPAVVVMASEPMEPTVVSMSSENVEPTVVSVPPEYIEPPSVGAYVEIENDEVASECAEPTVAAPSTTQNGSGIVEKPVVVDPEGTAKNDQPVEPNEATESPQMQLLSPEAPAIELIPTVPEILEKSKDPILCMVTGETSASVASERLEDFVEPEKLVMMSVVPNKPEVPVVSAETEESTKSEKSATSENLTESVLSAESKTLEAAENVVEHVMSTDPEKSTEAETVVQPVETMQHKDMDVPHLEKQNSSSNAEDDSITTTENVKDSQVEKQIVTEVEKPDEMQISQNSTSLQSRENRVADSTMESVVLDDEVPDNSSNESGMSHHRYVVETEDITDEDEEIPTTKKIKLDEQKAAKGHAANHATATTASCSSGIALPVKKRKRVRFSQTLTHTVLFGGDAPLNATNSDRRVILKPISILKRRGVPRAVKSFDERHADYAVTSPNSRRMDTRPSTSSSIGLSVQEHYSNTRPALNRRLLNCQAKSTRSFDASSNISSRVEQINATAPEPPVLSIVSLNTVRDNNMSEREKCTEITQSELERPMSSNQDLSTSVPTFASGQPTYEINKTPQTEGKTSQPVGVIVSSSSKPGTTLNSGVSTGDVQSYPATSSCPTPAATPALAQLTISPSRQYTSDKTQTTKETSNDTPGNSAEEHEVVTIDADDIITVKVEVHKQQSCSDGTHQIPPTTIQNFQNFQNIIGQSEVPQEARKATTLARTKPSSRKSRPKSDAATSTRDMNPHAIIPSLSPAKTPVASTPLYYSRYPGVRILKKIPVNPQKPVAKQPGQSGWSVGVRQPAAMYSSSDANGQQNISTVTQNHVPRAVTSYGMTRSNGGLGIVTTATTPPGHQSRRNSLEALARAQTPAYQARRSSLETTINPLHTARRNSMETMKSVAPSGRPRPRLLQPRSKSADVGLHEIMPEYPQSGSSFRSQNYVAQQLPEPTPGPSRAVLNVASRHLRGVPTRVITRSLNYQKDSSALLRAMASAMADVSMTSVIRPPPKKNKNLMSLQDYMTAGRPRRLSERPSAIDLPPSLLELNSDSFEFREVRFADTNISAVYDPGTGLDLLFDCRHEHCSKRFSFTCLQDNLFRRHMIVRHQTEPADTLFLEHTVRSSRLRECTKCNGIMAYGFEAHRESCSPDIPMERAFQLPGVCEQSVTFRHCGLCDAKYTKRFALLEHIKSEHLFIYSKVLLDPDFRCAHCLLDFNDTADLMQHALACEERPSNDTICDLAKKCLECAICQTNHQNFGETKKCFTDAKVFRCYICCAIFKSTHKFHEHICTYHGFNPREKTLKCPLCADPEKFKLPDLPQHVLCVHYIPSLKAFMERFRLARRNKAATTTSKTLVVNQNTEGNSDSGENKRPFGLSPQALQELSSFEGTSATDSSTTEPSMIIKSVAGNVTNVTGTPSFTEKPESNIQSQSVLSINCVSSGGTLTVLPVQPDGNQLQLSSPHENPLSSVKISSVRSCSLKAVESLETSPPPHIQQTPVQRPQATHPLILPAAKFELPGHSTLAKVVDKEPTGTGGAVAPLSVPKAVLPSPSVNIQPANTAKPLTKPMNAPPPPPVTTSSSLFPFPQSPSIQLGSRSTSSPHLNSPRSTVIQLQNGAGSISIFPSTSGSGALPSKPSSPQATITRPPPPGSPQQSLPIRQPQTFLAKPPPTTRPSATISLAPEGLGLPQLTRFIRPGPFGPNPALRRQPQTLNPGSTGRPQQVNLNIPQLPLGTSISRVYPQKGPSTAVSLQNPGIQLK